MFAFLTVLALQIAAGDPGNADPTISDADFRAYFDAARAGKLVIPDEGLEEARRYRYVFVGGFHNERLPGYFAQNARELRAKGIPKDAVHFIFPSSHDTVTGNSRVVREQFEEIAALGPEKLVVIAHSRGSCDALAFALQNPEFVTEHVLALFLIQGAFGGTALADYVVGEGPPMDRRMPLGYRVAGHALANIEGFLLDHGKHGGLPSLSRRASREFWNDLLDESSAAIPLVSPKTFLHHKPDRPVGAPDLPAPDRVVSGNSFRRERRRDGPRRPELGRRRKGSRGARRGAHRSHQSVPLRSRCAEAEEGDRRCDRHEHRRTRGSEAVGTEECIAKEHGHLAERDQVEIRSMNPGTSRERLNFNPATDSGSEGRCQY